MNLKWYNSAVNVGREDVGLDTGSLSKTKSTDSENDPRSLGEKRGDQRGEEGVRTTGSETFVLIARSDQSSSGSVAERLP